MSKATEHVEKAQQLHHDMWKAYNAADQTKFWMKQSKFEEYISKCFEEAKLGDIITWYDGDDTVIRHGLVINIEFEGSLTLKKMYWLADQHVSYEL